MARFAVLPVRDGVVLPGAVTELNVGRPGSVAALRHAAEREEPVLVLLQRDPGVDDPKPGELFAVGTLCRVTHAERTSEDAVCVSVVGDQRASVVSIARSGDALLAEVEPLPWTPAEVALPAELKEGWRLLIDFGVRERFSARTLMELKAETEPEGLCVLSVMAPISPAQLQAVLESGDLQPVVAALMSLRDESWLARFLRWVRRIRR